MFKHNLLIILRNIKRNKTTFLINLIGLSTGLTCALLIFLWVNDEISVYKFHEKDSQLYQVMANHQNSDGIETWTGTPGLLAPALKEEVPGVVDRFVKVDFVRQNNGSAQCYRFHYHQKQEPSPQSRRN